MERTKVTEWPSVETTVNPATYERMAELHNERGVPITQLVRAALDKEYGAKPL
jgi:Ribbon-helix-helix domain